ncbi:MAG: guanosine-3',5'-bis(diphosphate) 3'-pyrophosphohydrolase [Azospira oryzae]|uniref:Bifunctional (P)ppGpp synthetase/guanosine-3',5'-bis(Diphosphate) 3'-pyrophosphohydrolase n=1 Tax=Pelomicrobium methylotrophicum TaxID=2602750 RepID=A0A5C7EP23_9PROT|nr:bifunctional (p)ppGpp synthetase/guanosine-3',5'-bis(diphosphate) 3'-pyrophosphohydrolase [Pelomicrobium methylotrophicum]PZP64949.1 MAG: guanosine-3',5'-bis(diphosphate) 3'-pyrophosphohydrolase [Azospira oryzae]PZP82929.1 MAG: guanosine-3',5'-bis(diphosphate) 3'-pyrophosphohydrolase [Azospira oryzae]TXF10014.1 bifunctional (p)ppGpp synthetase/guanosine-3',5'-bis(diphosphate) 3'-pyrophosphohydrolase [Pelomicrobium methylotrophicum]
MAEAELLFKELSSYLKPEDVVQLESAYHFSKAAHQGQFRKSGDPYISHPLAVTQILAQMRLDAQALTAALLHDVMEDTKVTKAEIASLFGNPVAELVDGVSKLDRMEFQSAEDAQAENFRKMLLAVSRDVRVILIKLADRLHNMRTLKSVEPEKRRRIARETLEIYAPIANRLGLNAIFQELQDLSFRHLYPNRYKVLAKAVKAARGNRREVVTKIQATLQQKLKEAGIEAEVYGREKHVYSIYKKMREKSLSFSQVLDILGFRVIVKDIASCYLALGVLHGLYKPIPGKFKDYIAIPKANGYQSLHTTVFSPLGTPIEVQIRTRTMHRIAESGVASHWLYKSSDAEFKELHQKTHQWLQSLLESLSESRDSVEFLEHLKVDLFPDEVYVFTPKGKILALPRGATAVDFAYAVHTDIGNRCVAAKINYELMPLRTELKNGDQVEIITASHAKPNPSWLNYVVTSKARFEIRHFLRTMQYEESAELGERLLAQAMSALGGKLEAVSDEQWDKLVRETSAKSKQEILADIGLGKRLAVVVARMLVAPGGEAAGGETPAPGAITLLGTEGMAVQYARCCRPIPGDPIIGLIKKGQGLVIHTHDCPMIGKTKGDPEKWLDVQWDPGITRSFGVTIRLVVANQRGVLAKVAAEIAEAGSNIENVSMDGEGAYTTMNFTLQVKNRVHLAKVMRSLRRIPEVARITRVKG